MDFVSGDRIKFDMPSRCASIESMKNMGVAVCCKTKENQIPELHRAD